LIFKALTSNKPVFPVDSVSCHGAGAGMGFSELHWGIKIGYPQEIYKKGVKFRDS